LSNPAVTEVVWTGSRKCLSRSRKFHVVSPATGPDVTVHRNSDDVTVGLS